jgi:transmembrane sensor
MKATHDINALISKFLAGEASPEEAMLLEDWKEESPENQQYYDESLAVFGLPDEWIDTDAAWMKVTSQLQPETPIRQLRPVLFMRIAAAVTILLAIGAFVLYLIPSNGKEQVFAAQTTKKAVKLTDGTAVTIAANSSVELAAGYGKNNRSLKLKGSGYFSVKHSEQLPFVIETGPIHIKDLGTKFDVRTTDDTIFVRVDEGIVMIYDNAGMKITLKANESAHYVIATGELELEVQTYAPETGVKTFVFDNQRLEDVVNRLKSVYSADIRIEDPQVKNCRITTQFKDEDLEIVLSIVTETLGLTLQKQGTSYLIKGQSCTN